MTITSPPAPQLRDGVEKIVGMEGLPLLHDTVSGTYHRVGDLASSIIDLFDGKRSSADIASAVKPELMLDPQPVEGGVAVTYDFVLDPEA